MSASRALGTSPLVTGLSADGGRVVGSATLDSDPAGTGGGHGWGPWVGATSGGRAPALDIFQVLCPWVPRARTFGEQRP